MWSQIRTVLPTETDAPCSFPAYQPVEGTCEKFSDAYMIFLQSANIPPSLEDGIRRLSEHQVEQEDEDANEVFNIVYVCVMAFIMFLI